MPAFVPSRHAIALVLACIVAASAAPALAETVTASPPAGPVTGVVRDTVLAFLGIPYAEPPVGPLRWQPPVPHAPWTTPRDASVVGAHCAQPASPFGVATNAEDCLFLNVYTPHRQLAAARDLRRKLPVMVWIHGGAFQVGESDEYDPTRLVHTGDVVVVTLNYRLGALGFLAHPALDAESPDGVSGNYGLLDQQLALQWVRDNIAAFGGNPKRVTIFGESAGGISVHAQLASPLAVGLFHRAIVESGGVFNQPTLAEAEATGQSIATAVGCDDQTAACLRAVSVDDLLANQGGGLSSWTPVIDGHVLPDPILKGLNRHSRVPVIEGSNHDEMRLFVAQFEITSGSGPLSEDQYADAVAGLLGVPVGIAEVLTPHYPVAAYGNVELALSALATDAAFACGARAAVTRLAPGMPTFAYEFDDANAPELFLPPTFFPYGAAHASEIQYIFDVPNQVGAPPLDADQQALAEVMVRYWTRFARTGKPRAPHAPQWRRHDPNDTAREFLISLVPPRPEGSSGSAFAAQHQCSFWKPLLGF